MNLIDKYLKKLGVSSYEDLNQEEKETLKTWEMALGGRKITEEEYKNFLNSELEAAITRLCEVDLSKEAEIFRKVEVRVIKKIISFASMPIVEKQLLEKQLESKLYE
jgi:hypothetical protein